MAYRILVPVEGRTASDDAPACVEDLARRLAAEVLFLQVVDLGEALLVAASAGSAFSSELLARELATDVSAARGQLALLAARWRARGIDARWEVIHGLPARSVVDYARRHHADLIAMSTRGRSGLARLLFGSVASEVARRADVPVLLVRRGQTVSDGGLPASHRRDWRSATRLTPQLATTAEQ